MGRGFGGGGGKIRSRPAHRRVHAAPAPPYRGHQAGPQHRLAALCGKVLGICEVRFTKDDLKSLNGSGVQCVTQEDELWCLARRRTRADEEIYRRFSVWKSF